MYGIVYKYRRLSQAFCTVMNKYMKKPRGRPRKFDERAVFQQAQQVFLEEGFEAAAYEQVAEAAGLSKPSLYNAFGDKTDLFERVLSEYAQMGRKHIVEAFADADTLADGVKNFLVATAAFYSRPNKLSIGCLLVGTALPACAYSKKVQQILVTFVQSLEDNLEQIISSQYASDLKQSGKTSKLMALQLSSLLFALAVKARTGLSKKQLTAVAQELSKLAP